MLMADLRCTMHEAVERPFELTRVGADVRDRDCEAVPSARSGVQNLTVRSTVAAQVPFVTFLVQFHDRFKVVEPLEGRIVLAPAGAEGRCVGVYCSSTAAR